MLKYLLIIFLFVSISIIAKTPFVSAACICQSDNTCSLGCAFQTTAGSRCMIGSTTINPFVSAPSDADKTSWCMSVTRAQGDANGDGIIDDLDYFYYVRVVNGALIPHNVNPDVNGDGEIGLSDRGIIVANMGKTILTPTLTLTPQPTLTSVPHPTVTNTPVPTSPSSSLPWLKTSGNQILEVGNNQRVELRGVNLLRVEWVYPNMTFDTAAFPELANNWHANLVTHGFASAPVVANDAQYLSILDQYQRLAEQNHMYIIFCYYYHDINGNQPEKPNDDPDAKTALVKLVQRYKAKSNVMFMLQAEPHSGVNRVTWNTLRPIYDDMITAMRAVDNPAPNKHLILASGDGWGRDISAVVTDEYGIGHPDPITADGGQNIVYSSHPYDPPSAWSYFLQTYDGGYPVLVTEFGTGGQMSQSDVNTLMTTLNSGTRHISWTAWAFDTEGPPTLLEPGTDRMQFIPSNPYGQSVKAKIVQEAKIP